MSKHDQQKDLAYYITQYKIKGHSTWRCHSSKLPSGCEKEAKNNNWPPFTDFRQFRMDRITGLIEPYEKKST